MAVPKKKLSESKRRIKRQGEKIKSIFLTKCADCGRSIRPHFICIECISTPK